MMSMNNNKRKGRPTANYSSKVGRPKVYNDKNMAFEGVYGNFRLMHATASLLGSVVQIQVRDGTTYEGILKTISQQYEVVLEMTHKVSMKSPPAQGVGPAVSTLLASFPFEDGISDKLIFRLTDIVTLSVNNVDESFAVKGGSFTDTEISQRFNGGQAMEKELQPWEGGSSDLENTALMVEEDDGSNGWDANDMFRLNAEKYGVKSSYEASMQEYTVPLTKKDTEEYKMKEAKASKIALEIEANNAYHSRIQLENGDEEDRFSAVVRPDDASSNKYVLPQKRRNMPGLPKRQSIPQSVSPVHSSGSKPYVQHSLSGPMPPQPSSKPYVPHHLRSSPPLAHQAQPPPPALQEVSERCAPLNGEGLSEDPSKTAPSLSESPPSLPPAPPKPYAIQSSQTLPPRIERRRENERKMAKQKGRNDEIEEFRKFSSNFKLTEESKEPSDNRDDFSGAESKTDSTLLANKLAEQCKLEKDAEEKTTDISKSTLNPNAKEFVFNPNAKSFTPRSMTVNPSPPGVPPQQQPPPPPPPQHQQQQPQRLQAQSPVIVMPHSQMLGGIPQPLFTAVAPPQYVMQPFTAASLSASQPPRFRKVPLTMQPRHDMTPSMHVAAATGQPILAPAPTPSQLTMQYATSPQGVLHASGPPQQAMGYPQMNFVVGPRVVSPQPVQVAPTSHSVSYCDTSHLPAHLIMSAHPTQGPPQAHPPQSQTPVLQQHPAPSPVHQQGAPPPPQAPSAAAAAVMYPGHQPHHHHHPLQHHHPAAVMHHHHHHPGPFPGGPQPVVLMAQQPHHHHQQQQQAAGSHPLHMHQTHQMHGGGAHHIVPQMTTVQMIPTSMTPTTIATPPFVQQHPQGYGQMYNIFTYKENQLS